MESEQFQTPAESEPGGMPPQVSLGMALLAEGLQRGLAWARRAIVEPHASHTDPAEHPDCVLCVAMLALQGATEATQGQARQTWTEESPDMEVPTVIEWVPVRRRPAGSDTSP